ISSISSLRMLLADAPPGGPGGEASPLRACHKVCASDCDRRWCLWALQIRLFFGLQTHQRRSDLRLWSILRPFYPFSCAVASRQLMGGSSEKVLSPRLRQGLACLSHWLQFDLIPHALESADQSFLDQLSIPLIEIRAA